MEKTERPLSPHLTIYRWPITMTLSILHRATGVALSVGLIALVVWLESIASGRDAYAGVMQWFGTTLGKLLLLGWTAAFFFHLANGVRHLFWDVGLGFEPRQATASAWLVVVATLLLTAGYWVLI
ncbi:MAG: succinate dehydrogenase, cytochrome b556 subunit [Woeseiaceae bacterium]|nr:succinate dehydrogenase, cytochrome b556 subunit [Woeseiaceae bacterium]